jgi:hypothetical protein
MYQSAFHICSLYAYLVSIHKSILDTNKVSNAEISNFSQGQGNQGITRPAFRREQVIPQIDAEIAEKGNFWMETT